jgi:hypothetical protein
VLPDDFFADRRLRSLVLLDKRKEVARAAVLHDDAQLAPVRFCIPDIKHYVRLQATEVHVRSHLPLTEERLVKTDDVAVLEGREKAHFVESVRDLSLSHL